MEEVEVEVEVVVKQEMKQSNTTKRIVLSSSKSSPSCLINNLDDGCLMHIFSFLSPIPDRYNTALVCHRWLFLACHPRLWLPVERSIKDPLEPGVFPTIETVVAAARPGDTILISAGGRHLASDIQIKKPLCLIGGGELPDETTLICSRGADSALEFLSTCKLANLTVKTELGCCLLHRSGRLTVDGCVLQCESNPLDFLSVPIVSTASAQTVLSTSVKCYKDGVSVSRTRIEGGAKAVSTSGDLTVLVKGGVWSGTLNRTLWHFEENGVYTVRGGYHVGWKMVTSSSGEFPRKGHHTDLISDEPSVFLQGVLYADECRCQYNIEILIQR